MSIKSAFLAVTLLAGTTTVMADDWTSELQVHGFASQGYVKTDNNDFMGDSSRGSFDFTELGLNGSLQLRADLRLSGQLLLRRAGDMYDGSPVLDYGLLDYTLNANEQQRLGVLAGRFKNPLGLYNDTRDVAFTRPGVLLPQNIYFDKVRNFILSNDGVQVYAEFFGADDVLNIQLGLGRSPIDENVKFAYLGGHPLTGAELPGDLEPDGLTMVARVLYELDGGRWRLAASVADGSAHFEGSQTIGPLGPYPGDGQVDIEYYVLSAQFNAELWSLTAEFMREPINWANFSPASPFFGESATAEGYYLQADYRFDSAWQGFLRYEAGYADRDDRDGEAASARFRGTVPGHDFYNRNWVAGLRWDFARDWMLRSELHRQRGTFTLSNRENPDKAVLEKDWNLFALLISYRF